MDRDSKIIGIIVALIVLLFLFWNKLFGVSSTVAGVPVPASAGTAMAAATSNPAPSNAPDIVPYNPGPIPNFMESVSGLNRSDFLAINDLSFHPAVVTMPGAKA